MALNWNPTTAEEIAQNVHAILKTAPGALPLARALGTPQDVVDTPISAAAARLVADVIRSVRTYETRAKVVKVPLSLDADGVLVATVQWEGVAP